MNTDLFFQIFNLSGNNSLLDNLMIFATIDLIYLMIFLVFILSIKGKIKEKKAMFLIILSLPIAVLLIKAIHIFYSEPRPFVSYQFPPLVSEKMNATFPSRHTVISSVIAFSYLYFKSKWAPLFLFAMIWIAISRVYVGVHYPLDLLGGLIVSALSLKIALWIKKVLQVHFLR